MIGAAPVLMKMLSVAGTIAMFLVGGGIITHQIPAIHHYTENLSSIMSIGVDFFIGIIAGAISAAAYFACKKIKAIF